MANAPSGEGSLFQVRIADDVRARLSALATTLHRSEDELVEAAIMAMVGDQTWEERVHKGLAAADRGELVDADDVDSYWDAKLAGKNPAKLR